jgi:hypothetical protein
MKTRLLVFLNLLLFFSCNPKNKLVIDTDELKLSKVIALQKLDSIRIDYLGKSTIHDLDPESRTVLFMEHKESFEQIIIADFDGKILSSFSKLGDIPDGYGRLISTLRIIDANSFIAYAYNGFMTYNKEGKALSRVKLIEFHTPNYVPMLMGYGLEKIGEKYLYINQDSPVNNDYSDINRYSEMYLLDLLNPATGEKEPIIKIPESSIFRNGKYFFRNAWDPVFHLADNKIYVAFGLDPTIYAFDDNAPYTLDFSLPLNLPEYNYFKGTDEYSDDFSFFGLRFISGMILNVKKFDGYFLVAYFPGYDLMDAEIYFENKSPEEAKIFRDSMQQKYPSRIAIVDSIVNVINDFVPKGLEPRSMLVRNGELWMMEKSDEEIERDYFRLFKVGLKSEN